MLKKPSENRGPVDGIGGAEKRIPPAGPAVKTERSPLPRSNDVIDQRTRTISLRHNRSFSGRGFMSRHKRKMEGKK